MVFDRLMQQTLLAQAAIESAFLAKRNVVGVAVGKKESEGHLLDEMAVVALVREKKPRAQLSLADMIPSSIDGVRTDVIAVGDLRAQATQSPRERFRPYIPSGVSVGHYQITAGTLGAVVFDRDTGEKLLLSNNHVLANNNSAQMGDTILQPGVIDGGQNTADKVAELGRFIPLRYVGDVVETPEPTPDPTPDPNPSPDPSGCVNFFVMLTNIIAGISGSNQRASLSNSSVSAQSAAPIMPAPTFAAQNISGQVVDNQLDAAIARPINPDAFTDDILNIGRIIGTKAPSLGMNVRKQGRTTGLTTGTITLLNATVNVGYGSGTARFTGQVITSPMSQGGDSGSLVVDVNENLAVGLLFAGSDLATIFTPIDVVLASLNVRF